MSITPVPATEPPVENGLAGGLAALIAIPVGVVLMALLSSVGLIASIVGWVVAAGAVWLYRLGSGGVISRTGAWVVTAIVTVTLLLGIWADLVVGAAGGLAHLDNIGADGFWAAFGAAFPELVSQSVLTIVLTLLFGGLGAYRTLRRAFLTAHVTKRPNYFPAVPPSTPSSSTPSSTTPPASTYTVYQNDVDAPPTGSADDKTAPPTIN